MAWKNTPKYNFLYHRTPRQELLIEFWVKLKAPSGLPLGAFNFTLHVCSIFYLFLIYGTDKNMEQLSLGETHKRKGFQNFLSLFSNAEFIQINEYFHFCEEEV